MIRKPELVNQLRGDFLRLVGVRMTLDSSSPIDTCESVTSATLGILNVHQRGEVMLLGETLVTRDLELPPQDTVSDGEERVSPRHDEEVRAHPELLERDLGEHGVSSTSDVAFPEPRLVGDELEEATVREADASGGGRRIVRGLEEGTVDEGEGAERDAVLGEDGEVGVGGVVEEGGGEETARGGDQSWGGA